MYFLVSLILFPLQIIGIFIPKNKKKWVFGCSSGLYYKDNSKYFFEFSSNKKNVKAIWITKNKEVIKKIRQMGYECYHFYSMIGVFHAITAGLIFISYSYSDVSFFCYIFPKKSKIINLWHGVAPKKMRQDQISGFLKKTIRNFLRLSLGRNYDYIITTSDKTISNLDAYFEVGKKKYLVSGYPRNDIFFNRESNKEVKKLIKNLSIKDKKIILYLPTYRKYEIDKKYILDTKLNFKKISKLLKRHNAFFFVKFHPVEKEIVRQINKYIKQVDNINVLSNDFLEGDIYPLLARADVLITDYSSVYSDFLLTKKPIIFFPFDLNKYQNKDAGFLANYDDITPGPKVSNWNELCSQLEVILSGKDDFEKSRNRICNLFNRYKDGRSSERLFNKLISIK